MIGVKGARFVHHVPTTSGGVTGSASAASSASSAPPVVIGKLLDTSVPAAQGAYSVARLLRTGYAGAALRVQRTSDNTQSDIGFNADGSLNTTALASFCGTAVGFCVKLYDQSGTGRDLIQTDPGHALRIWTGTTVEKLNGFPALHATNQDQGMVTNTFTTQTGTAATACLVGCLSATASSFSPRYISLIPAGSGLIDVDQTGIELITRDGGSTPTQQWATQRNNSGFKLSSTGIFGQLQQVTAAVSGSSYTLTVDGVDKTGSYTSVNFNYNRYGLCFTGATPAQTATDTYITELVVWDSLVATGARKIGAQNQSNYFASAQAQASYLLDTAGLPTPAGAYSLRKLRAGYAGAALRVQRTSDSTQADIGFTGSGDLDTSALATFCGTAQGLVAKWYDQSGSGHDLTQSTAAKMWSIWSGTAVQTQNSLPALRALNATSGMASTAFTAYTGNAVSGALVGAMNATANSTGSPRFLSLWGASNTDVGDNQGVALFTRDGSTTPTQNWATNHHSAAPKALAPGVYGQLQQVQAVVTLPTTASIAVDGGTPGTGGTNGVDSAFGITTIAIGLGTSTTYISTTDSYECEAVVWFSALSSTNQSAVQANQRSYWTTTAPTGTGGGTTGGGTGGSTGGGGSAPPTTTANLTAAYQGFGSGYVDSAGRVIRHDQGGDIVSEGQAYRMKMAVLQQDKSTFDLVNTWSINNIQRSLPASGKTTFKSCWAWKNYPSGTNGVSVADWNHATDAEFDRAEALWRAIQLWGDQAYKDQLSALVADLKNDMIVDGIYAYQATDEWNAAPGHHTNGSGYVIEVNPSYFRPHVYRMLKDYTGDTIWDKAIAGCYHLATIASDATSGLPPDWCYYDTGTHTTGALVSGTAGWGYSRDINYSYDAVRLPIFFYMDWLFNGEALAATYLGGNIKTTFVNDWTSSSVPHSLASERDHTGAALNGNRYNNNIFNAAAYVTIITNDTANATGAAIKSGLLSSLYTNSGQTYFYYTAGGSSSYYGDAWLWFWEAVDNGLYADMLKKASTSPGALTLPSAQSSAGWTQIFSDTFNSVFTNAGNTSGPNPSYWGLYGPPTVVNGVPTKNGNEGVGYRYPSQDVVVPSTPELTIVDHDDIGGGMANKGYTGSSQRYGRWDVWFRQEPGVGYGPAILLWTTGTWPTDGEIDIVEMPEGLCQKIHTTCHIGSGNSQTGVTLNGDYTGIHVVSCEWTSTRIEFFLDGTSYYKNTNLSFQPPKPMWLGIQLDVGAAGHFISARTATTPQPVRLHIYKVVVYQPNGAP